MIRKSELFWNEFLILCLLLTEICRDMPSSVFQLQQVEIVLQNALHSQKGEITTRLRETMRMRIFDFNSFLLFKRKIAVAYRLWERTFRKQQDQDSIEWTQLLINCRILLIPKQNQGPLQEGSSTCLDGCDGTPFSSRIPTAPQSFSPDRWKDKPIVPRQNALFRSTT